MGWFRSSTLVFEVFDISESDHLGHINWGHINWVFDISESHQLGHINWGRITWDTFGNQRG